jgi:glycerophosphoryl diester phosphodiesterase
MKFFLILFSIFISISCAGKKKKKNCIKEKKNPKYELRNIEEFDDSNYRRDIENINILSISYELTYDKNSVLKVILKSIDDLEHDINFTAVLRSEKGKKDYILKCSNVSDTLIDCYSQKNVRFNLNDKYYFRYKYNGNLTLDEKVVMEDWKKVNLVFKPEMYENEIMWKDHRKILGLNNRVMIGGGYLYVVPKSKKLLHKPKDGINKYFELNNFIAHAGLYGQRPESSLTAYREAIKRGFHIVEASIQFTKDKIPVVMHSLELDKVSDGKGKISEFTLAELEKLDFGKKFDEKYAGEKILTFERLLQLCRYHSAIIDIDLGQIKYKDYFEATDEYAKIIINMLSKYEMLNSVFFNEAPNPKTILKLKGIKKEISVCVSNIKSVEDLQKIKTKYAGSKRIIVNFSELASGKEIDDKLLKYAKSLGYKIKVSTVDDEELADKLQSLGVNFITTNKLPPFLIKNEYEIPIFLKCTQFDVLADCRLGPEVKLIDNEIYNIYYSGNIYKLYENISDTPIGEFKYLDTIKLDDRYYTVKIFDFEKAYLKLNSSVRVDKGENITGKVGPAHENVADCYLYDFFCDGNNKHEVHCKIFKNNRSIVEYDGNYTINVVTNYSLYDPINELLQNSFYTMHKNTNAIFYFPTVIFVVIATFVVIYAIRRKNSYSQLREIRIVDTNPETIHMNK